MEVASLGVVVLDSCTGVEQVIDPSALFVHDAYLVPSRAERNPSHRVRLFYLGRWAVLRWTFNRARVWNL
jgi:hypothetical protein